MFREMRRKKQKLTEKQCIDILKKAKTATLALHGDDGYPYSCLLYTSDAADE